MWEGATLGTTGRTCSSKKMGTIGVPPGDDAPIRPEEEILAAIWREVLGVERVGSADDFFDLGGGSLSATMVAARLETAYGIEFPIDLIFNAPTIGELAAEVSELRLTARSRERETGTSEGARRNLRRASRDGPLLLSAHEARLWFLHEYEPEAATYNLPVGLRLRGRLDRTALERALEELVRRHESLRTRYVAEGGEPRRLVDPIAPMSLEYVDFDLEQVAERDREATAQGRLWPRVQAPFDLARGPAFRVTLARLASDDHILLLLIHHIVSDGWSMGVLKRELSVLYAAFARGLPSPLDEPSLQYVDYAAWEREAWQDQRLASQVSYWKQHLTGLPALELPADRPRPAKQSTLGARCAFTLDAALTARIDALGREHGTTLFMTLLGAVAALIARMSGQRDFAIGTPVAHRVRTELEPLVGFFVNTLALRMDLLGSPTVREWLGRVRDETLGAFTNQDVPFQRLVEVFQPSRDLSRSPLFQVMFALHDMEDETRSLGALTVEPFQMPSHSSQVDLTFSFEQRSGALDGTIEYATALFDSRTIERLADHLHVLLNAMLTDAEQRVDTMPLMTPGERQRVLVEWNDTRRDYASSKCIHELIEDRAAAGADAVAVVSGPDELTYGELNARANALALRLVAAGVGPGRFVGVCVNRTAAMAVALLAVLKAGAAYIPLDPSYPRARLHAMLQDAQPAMVLTDAASEPGLPQTTRRWRMEEVAQQSHPANLGRRATAGDLAYLIYTSGSTGRPKGVQIEHRSVLNLLASLGSQTDFKARDVLLAVTSLSFDIAGLELYLPLTTGGKVVLAERAAMADGRTLLRLVRTLGVTFIQATPSTWSLLLDAGLARHDGVVGLCGGEAIAPKLSQRLALATVGAWNVYGPTETTIWSTSWRLPVSAECVSIGRPLANTQLYILDQAMEPVPQAVVGELWIGGEGIARGYHGRPDLTAERFAANPFGPGRIYRTGDLARYRSSGDVEFLGRCDHQVKMRGFRIELGDIEAALLRQPGVRECVVVARDDGTGAKCLVAYVAPANLQGPPLRAALDLALPAYMIPSAFVSLAALPLTPNGKIDRSALPAPEARVAAAQYVGPRTSGEALLCRVWCDVLRLERVGIHDNFFELGGHSLLATQVVSRIFRQIALDLPVRALFDAPTVALLAERLAIAQLNSANGDELMSLLSEVERISDEEARAVLRRATIPPAAPRG